MIAVNGTYYNGQLQIEEEVKTLKPVKVVVTFLDDVEKIKHSPKRKRLQLSDFSFAESRELLKDMKGSLSEAVIEERRSYL
ncbi:MAG: hypothetical protein FJ218_11110 [Ignavibacteria bacterium]|nr:hypothetical protein [Ignavibacteria bacterium]